MADTREKRPRGSARDAALRLLAVRWRSRMELERRLTSSGYPREEIEAALERLEDVGLVDDERFAREIVRDQASRRLAGSRAIRATLREKGVDEAIAQASLEAAGDEAERAFELASRRAGRLTALPPEAAYSRLLGLLLRRGYSGALAREASRAALAAAFSHEIPPDHDS